LAPIDYYEASQQIAEYEKRRAKKYRNSGWRYYDSYYRGAKYGRLLPTTGGVYYTTQAWRVLEKCWLGYKIAKGQNDFETMKILCRRDNQGPEGAWVGNRKLSKSGIMWHRRR